MENIKNHKQDWENLGELDPLWAVLSDNSKRFNNWSIEEFLGTGKKEVGDVLSVMNDLKLNPEKGEMLDFGCGVGRLARHWLSYFNRYIGCDISSTMLNRAKKINQDIIESVDFVENGEDLKIFPDKKFDFIYSGIVLQHIPSRDMIKSYILEFNRILKEGGVLAFQLPTNIPWRFRFQPVRKIYSGLKFLGISDGFLYNQLGLYPMKMNFIPEDIMRGFLEKVGFRIVDVKSDTYCGPSVKSRTYYCVKNN
ncbi:MAG: class I SAM-dependent methyltransferase [Patescibacteria group bacterium]